MPTLSLKKKDLPFLLGGSGDVAVDSGDLKLNQAIAEDTPSLLSVPFNAGGDDKVVLGQSDSVKVGLSTKASVELTPVFSTSTGAAAKLLKTYGLADFFKKGANSDKLVLCFEAAASGDIAATGSFSYSILKTSVQLDAGADAGYAYLRALDKAGRIGAAETVLMISAQGPTGGRRRSSRTITENSRTGIVPPQGGSDSAGRVAGRATVIPSEGSGLLGPLD